MKRTLFIFCIAVFALTGLHATPNFIGTWTATVEYNRQFGETLECKFTPQKVTLMRIFIQRSHKMNIRFTGRPDSTEEASDSSA